MDDPAVGTAMSAERTMTIQELKNYKKLNKSIRYWKRELAILKKESLVKSPQMTGMPGSGKMPDPTAERALKEAKLMEKLERMLQKQQEESDRIMNWILTIDDPMIQTIMHARYIRDKSWRAISFLVGGNNTEESVRKMHTRYLSEMSDNSA